MLFCLDVRCETGGLFRRARGSLAYNHDLMNTTEYMEMRGDKSVWWCTKGPRCNGREVGERGKVTLAKSPERESESLPSEKKKRSKSAANTILTADTFTFVT